MTSLYQTKQYPNAGCGPQPKYHAHDDGLTANVFVSVHQRSWEGIVNGLSNRRGEDYHGWTIASPHYTGSSRDREALGIFPSVKLIRDDIQIFLSPNAKNLRPAAVISIGSHTLWKHGLETAWTMASEAMYRVEDAAGARQWNDREGSRTLAHEIRRWDWCLDAYGVRVKEFADRLFNRQCVSSLKPVLWNYPPESIAWSTQRRSRRLTIYDKPTQLTGKKSRDDAYQLAKANGWDGVEPWTRIELQFFAMGLRLGSRRNGEGILKVSPLAKYKASLIADTLKGHGSASPIVRFIDRPRTLRGPQRVCPLWASVVDAMVSQAGERPDERFPWQAPVRRPVANPSRPRRVAVVRRRKPVVAHNWPEVVPK